MTRQERLEALAKASGDAIGFGDEVRSYPLPTKWTDDLVGCAVEAFHAGNKALDHLAALEQQAITDYLADVPLPEGWTEDQDSSWGDQCYRYLDAEGNERVAAFKSGTCIWMKPAHWPAIPSAVLVRAAVQCAKLREQR